MSGSLSLSYINDLPHVVLDFVTPMYANDSSLCYQSSVMNILDEAISNNNKNRFYACFYEATTLKSYWRVAFEHSQQRA